MATNAIGKTIKFDIFLSSFVNNYLLRIFFATKVYKDGLFVKKLCL
jgi:hypothetical protein